ncbi:helix-turn-helix domain-containing protein [Comamonas aquatica]|uniref:helix-turn-helix domain-containing protein n=1 Tax=Comamonas aquatica TaxID=225991 RepID=UPI002447C18D|nr:helix-turn-helix domain-containing protein [Comamonas aquatica]MDH1673142.1 helix-turn-helix domain-containing protein [Comamonas aquatica]MDH1677857.1 helix-turn-helix domain-containing protein [Comamonas aquatica]
MQVQKLRLQRGWSQQQLAELSGLSVRTIQRIENGSAASMESLKSLASVFEIDFSTMSSEPAMPAMPDTPPPTSPSTHTPNAIQQEQLALLEVRKLKSFYLHLAQYVVVIAALCAINLLTTPHRLWFYWPALGWGIGILAHAATVFGWLPFLGVDWEKRQVEKRLGRPL